MLKTVVLLNIFVETMIKYFQDYFDEFEFFGTFDQCNAFFLLF